MSAAFGSENSRDLIILTTIAAIPMGQVSTYGDIAKQAGYPGLARHVAKILAKLPSSSNIPWHRVVNSQRRISFPKGSPAYFQQYKLLLKEGIEFQQSGLIPRTFFLPC